MSMFLDPGRVLFDDPAAFSSATLKAVAPRPNQFMRTIELYEEGGVR
ncbi:MAG: hypothetical protein HYV63_12845 [Candidatus Schekmanbacteria bacterium]|nr:hypothetical protein [Candidatus Schekmanbacteria bacterium]